MIDENFNTCVFCGSKMRMFKSGEKCSFPVLLCEACEKIRSPNGIWGYYKNDNDAGVLSALNIKIGNKQFHWNFILMKTTVFIIKDDKKTSIDFDYIVQFGDTPERIIRRFKKLLVFI